MPGIIGLVTRMPREQATAELFRMVEALRHEDFYVTGTWIEESLGVYVGWVARKGSFSDGMPLRNERGDAVLVFSGEELPEPDTVQRLRKRGHDFDAAGESDYLVHLYEDDPCFQAGLNGRFHGLLIDRNDSTATLFNDRYGMHRIYYHRIARCVLFCCRSKSDSRGSPRAQNHRSHKRWGNSFRADAALEGRTLFQGVRLLPGGSKWVFRGGSLEKKETYFQPRDWENEGALEPEAFYQELRNSFSRNLPRYFWRI